MTNMTNTKTCPVCAKVLEASRLAKYPNAVVCGRRACSKAYKRTAFNKIRKRYRDRRLASDPVYRLREREQARERYVKSRLRLEKTPALREPLVAHDLTDGLGWLRGGWVSILGSLKRMAADAWACRSAAAQAKREQARAYESLAWVLTRQGSMDPIKAPADAESGES